MSRAPVPVDGAPSVGSLVGDVAADVARLVRQEVDLAKAEIRGQARKAGQAGRLYGGGAVALHLAAAGVSIAVTAAASRLLADRLPQSEPYALAIAAGAMALVWLVVGLVLFGLGRRRLRSLSPIPRQTIKSIKEDLSWLRKLTD